MRGDVRREQRPTGDDARRRAALFERTGAQTPYPLFRVSRHNNIGKLALSGISLLLYSGIFLWLYPSAGGATVALSLVPVALAARWFGLRAGVGIPFATLLLHAFLFDLKEATGWTSVFRPESLAVGLASLVVGAVIGRLRDVYEQVAQLSDAERGALESKLGERGRVEAELRKSEERYRILSEASRDAVCLLTAEGLFIEVNQAALDLFGYTREELLDLKVQQLYANPADWAWIKEQLLVSEDDTLRNIRITIRSKDGAEMECLETDSLWRNAAGQIAGYRSIITDLTERKRIEEDIRNGEERLRMAMEAARMATWDMDSRTANITVSDTLEPLFGIAPQTPASTFQALLEHIHQDDRILLERAVSRAIDKKEKFELEIRVPSRDGEVRWMAARGHLVQGNDRWHVLGTFLDVTDRKKAEARVEHLGFYDALTELPNRRLFNDRINVALAQARRSGKMVAVLNLDLDNFKVINDTLGHAAGDRLLQEAADRLSTCVRAYDTVARQGGDEFMILVPAIERVDEADKIAQRIMAAFQEPFYVAGRKLHVSTSIGISVYPEDGDGPEPLIRNADAAMYRVKESGRNAYQFHTAAMYAAAFGRLELETGLRQALERQEFVLHYQPQLDITTGRIIGAEALVRWQSPSGKLLSPSEFIPLAEESGLILPLGEWVLRTACAQNKAWQDAGLPPLRLSVNISARQFQLADLPEKVSLILEETGLAPHWLTLEITETIAMMNVDHTTAALRDLAERGVAASLDDFGTGHASLNYLKDFPLHALKIDRSFVTQLPADQRNAAIATAVIGLGHALNLEVIAEGVDKQEQLDFLHSRECDTFQGYLFSAGVTHEEFAILLRENATPRRVRKPSVPSQ